MPLSLNDIRHLDAADTRYHLVGMTGREVTVIGFDHGNDGVHREH